MPIISLKYVCGQSHIEPNAENTIYRIRCNKRPCPNKRPSPYLSAYRADFPEHASF